MKNNPNFHPFPVLISEGFVKLFADIDNCKSISLGLEFLRNTPKV